MSLNVFVETITTGFLSESIFFISLISISFGISIIVTKNPVVSVLYLIGLFFSVSIYLMMLGLYFIGLSYLLVYVGAVSILFLFILMLISVRTSELLTEGKNSVPLAVISVLCFNYAVNPVLPHSVYIFDIFSSYLVYIKNYFSNKIIFWLSSNLNELALQGKVNMEIASVTSKSWDTSLIQSNHISSIGNILYTEYFIFLIITSIILLLSMVGTIIITVRK